MLDRYREELDANGHWLRFGFHASDEETRYDNCSAKQVGRDYAEVMGQFEDTFMTHEHTCIF